MNILNKSLKELFFKVNSNRRVLKRFYMSDFEKKNSVYNILKKALNDHEISFIDTFIKQMEFIKKNETITIDIDENKKKVNGILDKNTKSYIFLSYLKELRLELDSMKKKKKNVEVLTFIYVTEVYINIFTDIILKNMNDYDNNKDFVYIPVTLVFSSFYYKLSIKYSDVIIKEYSSKLLKKLVDLDVLEKKLIWEKSNWMVILKKSDIIEVLKMNFVYFKQDNLFQYIYINKIPADWFFLDGKHIKNIDENVQIPFVSLHQKILNNDFVSFINENYLNMINNLQKIGYTVNIDLFIFIFNTLDIRDFFNKVKKDLFIELNFDYNYYYQNSLKKRLMNKNIYDMEDYLAKIEKELHKISTYDLKEFEKSKSNLNVVQLIVLWFLYDYNYKDVIFHLNTIEFRGRISMSGVVNYISDKLYRFLICIDETESLYKNKEDQDIYWCYYFLKQYKKVKSFEESAQLGNTFFNHFIKENTFDYDALLKHIFEKEDINIISKMNLCKVVLDKRNATVSLDATSSLLQIIGILTKNTKLMKYTNVLHNKIELDIYLKLIEKIKEEFNKKDFTILKDYDKFFINYYTDRRIVKYSCMVYLYGSTPKYIANAMKKKFKLNNILLVDLISIVNKIVKLLLKVFPVLKYVKLLYQSFIRLLPLNLTIKYMLLDKVLEYNISEKKVIQFDTDIKENSNIAKELYLRIEEKKNKIEEIKKKIEEKKNNIREIKKLNVIFKKKIKQLKKMEDKKKIYISYKVFNFKKKDSKRRNRSFLVNVIHSFDSQICIKLRNTLYKKYNIQTLSVHDCFIININNYEACLKQYNIELSKLLETNFYTVVNDLQNLKYFVYKIIKNYNLNKEIYKIIFLFYQFIRKLPSYNDIKLKEFKNTDNDYIENKRSEFLIKEIFTTDKIFEKKITEFKKDISYKKIANQLELKYLWKYNNRFVEKSNDVLKIFNNKIFKNERTFYKYYLEKKNENTESFFNLIVDQFLKTVEEDLDDFLFNQFYLYTTKNIRKHLSNLKSLEDFKTSEINKILNSRYSLKPE